MVINSDKTVTSLDNESIMGTALDDGRIAWSGIVFLNNQTVYVSQVGLLLETPERLRAGKSIMVNIDFNKRLLL